MFLRCSYFLAKSEAEVLINSVLIKRKACSRKTETQEEKQINAVIKNYTDRPVNREVDLVLYGGLRVMNLLVGLCFAAKMTEFGQLATNEPITPSFVQRVNMRPRG